MIKNIDQECVFFEFESFKQENIKHGFFTRHGGVSPKPWNTLNIGSTVGDEQTNVNTNRHRLFNAIGRNENTIYDAWQVHGVNAVIADNPRNLKCPHIKADILITENPGVTLLARFADCVPIFLCDTKKKIISIVHAGWQGSVNKIANIAVDSMKSKFGCKPENIIAGIGPSIGPEKYEVGENVIKAVKNISDFNGADFLDLKNGRVHLDLWHLNEKMLFDSGIKQIELACICTASDTCNWFSHRKENGKTGRFGAILAL